MINKEWEKEWQGIEVPKEAVFKAIEEGLAEGPSIERITPVPQSKAKVKSFVKKHRVLLIAAASIMVATAGIATIGRDQTLRSAKSSSEVLHQERAVEESPKEEVQPKGQVEFEEAGEADEGATTPGAKAPEKASQKLVKTYSIAKETNDFSQTIASIEELVTQVGGYFSQANVSNQESQLRSADYLIRVPQENVSDFLKELNQFGETISSSESATDYSLSYSDNQSRINALQTEENALLKLLEKSDNVQDMIVIQERLSQVRSSKESLIGQNKLIDNQVAETEVALTVGEVKKITKEKTTTIFGRAQDNWRDQWSFWQGAGQHLSVFLLSVGPYLLGFVVILGTVWRLFKRRRA